MEIGPTQIGQRMAHWDGSLCPILPRKRFDTIESPPPVSPSAAELSDGALVADCLSGRHDRFAELVRRYEGALYRVAASRLGDGCAAEDVLQETMLCAFRYLHTYNSQYSFRTWLWTILLNQCRRHLSRHAKRPPIESLAGPHSPAAEGTTAEQLPGDEAGPLTRLLTKERNRQLEDRLAELPEAQADALRLRFYAGLKFQEIAETMGCSLSSAKNRVRWGLEKMAESMLPTNSGEESPSAADGTLARSENP